MTEEVQNPEAVLAELRRAQDDLKALRAENKKLQSAIDANDADTWRERCLKAETKLALDKTGISDADRLLPYVGTDGLNYDEKGTLTGLDDRLEQLKRDLPELFDPKRRAGGKADIFKSDVVNEVPDPLRQQVRAAITNG